MGDSEPAADASAPAEAAAVAEAEAAAAAEAPAAAAAAPKIKYEKRRMSGNLYYVTQKMSYHPDYYNQYLKTEDYLLRGDGPLRFDFRYYIAIMAAARHHCKPLMNYYKQKFIEEGGDKRWLLGLRFTPQKIRNLSEINKILAHTPWHLRQNHIEKLLKGSHKWTLGELCQILVLMAHFHCLCSFVFASENLIEVIVDPENPDVAITGEQYEEAKETVEELMEKMSILQKNDVNGCSDKTISFELPTETDNSLKFDFEVHRFLSDFSSPGGECDLSLKKNTREFLIQDCSWEDQAYSLLNRFYFDIGTLLDEKFKVAYDLTYYTMGHKDNVDTAIFRHAVWNYIHRIYGIIHDDYDYIAVEDLLDSGFRAYVDTLCFYPERVTEITFGEIMHSFRHSERVHVNLMVYEARLQAELLYALFAIMRYMT